MLHKTLILTVCTILVSALLPAVPFSAVSSNSPVADAAQRSDIEAVRTLLKQGAEVTASQGDGMAALHWAALNGNVDMAQILLYAGANLNATTRIGGYTPLLLAAKNGNPSLVEMLLNAGADVRSVTTSGITPVMLAAASGNAAAVQVLLDHGSDANVSEKTYGQTALMLAAALNRVDVIKVLIQRGAVTSVATKVRELQGIEKPKQTPAQAQAIRDRQGQIQGPAQNTLKDGLRTLLEDKGPKADYPMGGMTAMHYAAREGKIDALGSLLDGGADINFKSPADNSTPLLISATNGQFDTALFLLGRGADPNIANIAGTTPLYAVLNIQWASKAEYPKPMSAIRQKIGYLELTKAMLDHGADPNLRVKQSLWWSNYSVVNMGLVEAGATPFWRASQASDIDAMRLLVAAGADPRIPNSQGVTPLNAAAGDVWNGNYNVNSPAGWMPAVRYLADELGADVNAPDDMGSTPLHSAAWRGDNEMILYLVSKGADVTAVNKRDQTVADMANGPVQRLEPFPETIALLMHLGSKNNHRCVSC
jgi:ankyrin repeat protein